MALESKTGSAQYVSNWSKVLGVLNGSASAHGLVYYNSYPPSQPILSLSPDPQKVATEISSSLNNPKPDFTSVTADLKSLEASLSTQFSGHANSCSKAAAIIADAAPDIRVGFGYLESGTPGAFTHLRAGGETEWLAGRYPLPWRPFTNIAKIAADPGAVAGTNGSPSQLTYTLIGGSIQAQQASTLVTGNAKTPIINANIYSGWLGIENDAANYRLSLQAGYTDTFADQAMNKKFASHGFRWLATAAIQLPDEFNPIVALFNSKAQVWVNSSYGTANGSSTNLNDKTFLLSFTISPPTTVEILQPSS